MAVQQLVRDPAGGRLVGQFERLGAEPLGAHDGDEGVRQDALYGRICSKIFEFAHLVSCESAGGLPGRFEPAQAPLLTLLQGPDPVAENDLD